MSSDLVFQEPGIAETRQERAYRRAQQLHNAFQTAFEVLAEIYRDEDWRYINDAAGRPYTGFTAFVQDQLGCAASNARRYQQGIVGLILPLQELTAPGTRIPVTSSDVARLGVTGARVVIEQAPAALEGLTEPDAQTDALRQLIDSVTQRSTDPGFGPLTESQAPPASPLGTLVPASIPDDEDPDDDPPLPPADNHQGTDAPPWDEPNTTEHQRPASPDPNAQERPSAAAMPAEPATTPAETAAQPAPAAAQVMIDLEAAITAVLAAGEPTALAEQLAGGQGAALAPKCLASGQRLVRLGQLLRSLN
ncbi:hypothetical protein [Mycolicibacterium fortuitum]|uniref:Uncharacterized protein n=1 Tax=Mycolicibacterium fortuitum TaxID=1766 RepID=A0AAE4VHJ4_MYCFO|nr:hypothetical protein [Mycolicibacterium fortuitum]MDV7195376.1 hypothetical protein [Mycolicibacterium fortuitum]MDV7209105.1 hypothetical protein [Mycolicibacterium fortuitum]MDV7229226.1 hypothetical protein [Mycolicibacterium fortuitum]MDV7260925.1 hypothetical protein [Mycolicibacterium fortuitum]MDV7285934.1 hypothetical protein [Mycolicibacterium fortuitum]